MTRKHIMRIIKIGILLYCSVGIALYYLQDRFLFHPVKLDSNYTFAFKNFAEMKVPVNGTDTISLVKFLPADSIRKGIVVYFHGNMENVVHYASNAGFFTDRGYEVWMPDYPGFGKSTGERTEKKMLDQGMMVYNMAAASIPADSIVIYGRSLGTGIASYVASDVSCKALVLETPYYSIPSLFAHYAFLYPVNAMSNYKFPNYEYLPGVKSMVIILHGTKDNVVPFSNALKLKQLLKKDDSFITFEGGSHNNLSTFPLYTRIMDSVLR